jgi:hypothetical protein
MTVGAMREHGHCGQYGSCDEYAEDHALLPQISWLLSPVLNFIAETEEKEIDSKKRKLNDARKKAVGAASSGKSSSLFCSLPFLFFLLNYWVWKI